MAPGELKNDFLRVTVTVNGGLGANNEEPLDIVGTGPGRSLLFFFFFLPCYSIFLSSFPFFFFPFFAQLPFLGFQRV